MFLFSFFFLQVVAYSYSYCLRCAFMNQYKRAFHNKSSLPTPSVRQLGQRTEVNVHVDVGKRKTLWEREKRGRRKGTVRGGNAPAEYSRALSSPLSSLLDTHLRPMNAGEPVLFFGFLMAFGDVDRNQQR